MNYKLICGVAVLCVVLFLVFAFMRRRSAAPAQEVNENFDGQLEMDMVAEETDEEEVDEEDGDEDTDDEDDMA